MSAQYLLNRSTLFFFLTKHGFVVYYPAEKLVHYLQCQGHSEGLYNENMAIVVYAQPFFFFFLKTCYGDALS